MFTKYAKELAASPATTPTTTEIKAKPKPTQEEKNEAFGKRRLLMKEYMEAPANERDGIYQQIVETLKVNNPEKPTVANLDGLNDHEKELAIKDYAMVQDMRKQLALVTAEKRTPAFVEAAKSVMRNYKNSPDDQDIYQLIEATLKMIDDHTDRLKNSDKSLYEINRATRMACLLNWMDFIASKSDNSDNSDK